ncbi:glycoside hydrolase family 65 protein [Pyrococcus kukulkanii]|uniref:Glycoside hydrolase family 65 protein n=1 Tax=Pyrococcus kukulkanii TaxID=1609559 RepID=A0ABV4T4L7_9EURY
MKFVVEYEGSDPNKEKTSTLFTLANGYFGIKGDIEVEPSEYGTMVYGFYDNTPYFYREIVNGPRIIGIRIFLNGIEFVPSSLRAFTKRILNIEKGKVESYISSPVLEYSSTRIVHIKDRNLAILKFTIVPKEEGLLTIYNPIEFKQTNPSFIDEVRVKHYKIVKLKEYPTGIYSKIRTLDGKYELELASSLLFRGDFERVVLNKGEEFLEVYKIHVEKNRSYEFSKLIFVGEDIKKRLNNVKEVNIDKNIKEHENAWRELWEIAKVNISDSELERAVNFNIFHLLQSAPQTPIISIPARGLHGFGYRGHVFWDTEIYALPFFIATFPEKAKIMLLYRYNHLKEAKENASRNGFHGAQYPWESADDGYEATPSEIPLDISGKKKVRIYTGEEEHHITADIAYAVDLYYQFTGDEDFMRRYGLEIIIETAKFWASRVEWNGEKYVIKRVIGADEYHEHVNNNFFTNIMAKYNLYLVLKYFEDPKFRDVVIKKVSKEDIEKFKEIVHNFYIPRKINGVYEEFDGYFNLEDCVVDNIFEIGEKRLPLDVLKRIGKTKLVKQADVIMGMVLLKDKFSPEDMEKNFNYYIKRTTHASSLSMPPYAIMAAWLGYEDIAYRYLVKCANVDLLDIYGNTKDGFHVATAGGVWQIIFFGFLGIDIKEGRLKAFPRVPRNIKRISLKFKYRDRLYKAIYENGHLELIPLK